MSKRQYDINRYFEIKGNPLSKVGVFPYLGKSIGADEPDKIYYVYRPAEELASKETIDSFKLIPWVDDHDMIGIDVPGTMSADEKGVCGIVGEDVYFSNGVLYGNIKCFSKKLADQIDSGKRELSLGYRCTYEKESGSYNGQAYDYIQRGMIGNHVASVQRGRMGPDVRVLDGMTFDNMELDSNMTEKKQDGLKADALDARIGEIEKTVAATATAIDGLNKTLSELIEKQKKAASDEDEVKKEKAENEEDDEKADKAEDASIAALNKTIREQAAIIDGLKKAADALPEKIMKDVADKAALVKRVEKHIGSFDSDNMTVDGVAKYAAEKLGLKVGEGMERAALDGYLSALDAASGKVVNILPAGAKGNSGTAAPKSISAFSKRG